MSKPIIFDNLSDEDKKRYNNDEVTLERIRNTDHLFGEKRLKEMADSLSDEDKKKYAKIGEEMYNTVDFSKINEQGSDLSNETLIELENVAQLKLMLLSGIHPSFLTNQEKDMMKNNYGQKWYEDFGFLEVDLNRINF
jgi:hypothetical protein